MAEPKKAESVEAEDPPSRHVPKSYRTPAWRRQLLRRLAVHGEIPRAALECNITKQQVYRVMRAKPRFARAVKCAQGIALRAHSERMQSKLLDMAENGV